MKRRPCLALLLAAVAARICAGCGWPTWATVAGGCALLVLLAVKSYFTDRVFGRILLPVFFIVFFLVFNNRLESLQSIQERFSEAIEASDTGIFGNVSDIQEKNGSYYIFIEKLTDGDTDYGGLIYICDEAPEGLTIGGRVKITGEISRCATATNPGAFDEREYYRALGFYYKTYSAELEVITESHGLRQKLYEFREYIKAVIYKIADDDDAGVFCAMLLGDKGGLQTELKSLYQAGGISHILAISGLHVSFLGMLLFIFLRKIFGRYAPSALLASLVMILYALMTGASISVVRACIMFIISLVALVFGRTYDMISAMSIAWIVSIIIWPYQATQPGMLLSYGAIAGICMVSPIISRLFQDKVKPSKIEIIILRIRNAFISTISVSAVTFPVLAWFYYKIAVLSLLLNLVVIPLMSVLMASLLIGIGVYLCGFGTDFLFIPARICITPAHYILKLYELLCTWTESIKWSELITGRPLVWQMYAYYGVLIILLILLAALGVWLEKKHEKAKAVNKRGEYIIRNKAGRALLPILFGILLVGLLCLRRSRPSTPFIVFIDVGQGDGMYICGHDTDIMIDGGSTSKSNVSTTIENVLLYYGTGHLDAWFVTHPDEDHVCGTQALLGELDIDNVYYAEATPEEDMSDILSSCEEYNIPATAISAGAEFESEGLKLACLYPEKNEDSDNANDLSLVMKLKLGEKSILLTGDITSVAEERLVERYGESLSSDILKVAHHGSRYSSCEEFIEMVKPDYSVISCGVNNYGHPADRVVELLESVSSVHITLYDGAAVVEGDSLSY